MPVGGIAALAIFVALGVIGAVLLSFGVVPELMERFGYDSRSLGVRPVIWAAFLGLVFVPAAATGFLFGLTGGEVLLLSAALLVAAVYDCYRLRPARRPGSKEGP